MSASQTISYLTAITTANQRSIEKVASAIADCARTDGLVYTAGAGHSLALVMETFYRAGGLANVRPLYDPQVLPLASAAESTAAEREPGRGGALAKRAGVQAGDVVVVFSNSGVNPYPVEIAAHARATGATTVAVTSIAASRATPQRAAHRLVDLAHHVLDTATVAGDASWPSEAPVTAPQSSLASIFLWNLVLEKVVTIEPDTSLWRSANVVGNDCLNAAVFERFGQRIPELGVPGHRCGSS